MTRIPDWTDDLDALHTHASVITSRLESTARAEQIADPVTGKTCRLRIVVPSGDRGWANYYGYQGTPTHWVILDISLADTDNNPAGTFLIEGRAIRNTGDALAELALMAAELEPPSHVSMLTPSRRPPNRARTVDMEPEHAAHRVWQLILNRAAAVTIDGGDYPKTNALDGMVLFGATHYNRIKSRGTLHGIPFRFETTNKGYANLYLDHDRDGTWTLHGPLPIPDELHGESVDTHMAALIPVLRAETPAVNE